jgi:hypothetical protein
MQYSNGFTVRWPRWMVDRGRAAMFYDPALPLPLRLGPHGRCMCRMSTSSTTAGIRDRGTGRPTKRDRREMERLRREG